MALIALLLADVTEAAPFVRLEHTFVADAVSGGGSSWGTEDSLLSALEVSDEELPEVFKLPLARPEPLPLRVEAGSGLRGLYDDDVIRLYSSLHICADRGLDLTGPGFADALATFTHVISGGGPGREGMEVRVIRVDRRANRQVAAAPSAFRDCDVLVFQADSGEYPFSRLPEGGAGARGPQGPGDGPQFPRMVMGLFYRHSPRHLPAIVFHPRIRIDFSGSDSRYFRPESGSNPDGPIGTVDGRTILFHELGHLLGFAHVDWKYMGTRSVEAASVMGVNNTVREDSDVQLRFFSNSDVWRHWEPRQTSFYRSWIQRRRAGLPIPASPVRSGFQSQRIPVCLYPGESIHFRLGLIFSMNNGIGDDLTALPPGLTLPRPSRGVTRSGDPNRSPWIYSLSPRLELGVMEFGAGAGGPALLLDRLASDLVSFESNGWYFSLEGHAPLTSAQSMSPVGWATYFRWKENYIPIREKLEFVIRSDLENCYSSQL